MSVTVSDAVIPSMETLVLQFLGWLDSRERTYEEVMESWRTSCPRTPVWEEANQRGLVCRALSGGVEVIQLTTAGADILRRHRFLNIMHNYLRVSREW